MVAVKPETEAVEEGVCEGCPLHAKDPPFNAQVLAAIAEGEAIFKGELPAKWYHSIEEAREDLSI